jgi:hypothetical protein
MRRSGFKQLTYLLCAAISPLAVQSPVLCQATEVATTVHPAYLALPLTSAQDTAGPKALDRYGIPFLEGALPGGTAQVKVGSRVKRIFLLGMTESARPQAWSGPNDYSYRYFIGDNLGQIRLNYVDGSTQEFPMILGESVWWGVPFYRSPNPFPADAHLRSVFANALHLYPAAPVEDGKYVAVIVPKTTALSSIEIVNSPQKKGSVAISGITVECAGNEEIAGATMLPPGHPSAEFEKFAQEKALRPDGTDEPPAQQRLDDLRHALYSNDEEFKGPVAAEVPQGYSGPEVSFKGNLTAGILQNAFYANVKDMLDKIDADGTYHTSTRGAISWGVGEFGTYRTDAGLYYKDSWSRDLGRSLQEVTELGYLNQATHTADYSLRSERLWENPAIKYHGESLPPHWSRVINRPDPSGPFENDGHALISLFLYKLWQRLPDRDAWLHSHWTDVKAAGDWVPWQFDHPDVSGAANGVLYTTGESAGGKGYSVYPDFVCMTALQALAQMADSIGEAQSAALWRDRAEKMRKAIPARYLINDTKYGQVWTLESAGWANRGTVLGPLIFLADTKGFAPEDDDPALRPANQAAFQRLIDSYRPLGFYGEGMGYGQGFVTQAALLLDRMSDVTPMLDWAAKEIYDPRFGSFVVPEGVVIDPTRQYWFRTGDLGNGVQEAEIVKALRIVIGVDDTQPQRLRIFPRMPYGWDEIAVEKYPVLFERAGKAATALVHYKLERTATQMNLNISSDKTLGAVTVRVGPFAHQPNASSVLFNGKLPAGASIQHSGDSWWVRFTSAIGPSPGITQ